MSNPGAGNGIDLARVYWSQVVRPVLDEHCASIRRAAARIGGGSDVLGLDDQMSRDHDWGLRLQLFVSDGDVATVLDVLRTHLPNEFAGLPTRFAFTGQDEATLAVDVLSVDGLVSTHLGFDPRIDPTPLDWLSLTGQAALEITAGEVFDDSDDELTSLRQALVWYPDDVWRYVVACDWQRLDQELPLMGRAAGRGDELGSRLIAARLVDITIHLAFVLCRQWAPYSKWRGTMFRALAVPTKLGEALHNVLTANDPRSRADRLVVALSLLARIQRANGLPSADPVCIPFWDRPYVQVDQGLVRRLLDSITDPVLRDLPAGLGSIEQRTDNVDLLVQTHLRRAAVL
ncbi:MAG: DUF4037 domain-containing protein, partial [Ornithinimicrobium sp.]